jgi:hypothetical protein
MKAATSRFKENKVKTDAYPKALLHSQQSTKMHNTASISYSIHSS